jgi:hypothetical protein
MNQEKHSSTQEQDRIKQLEKKVDNLEKMIDLTIKTREHDKKFGKYEMM